MWKRDWLSSKLSGYFSSHYLKIDIPGSSDTGMSVKLDGENDNIGLETCVGITVFINL